jgi:hypothetical protein
MAERRMFAKTIIDSDAFLDMPLSTQALYFHLSMRADDDGFINNPKKIQRTVGASEDDLRLLIAKNFIIPFESGIVVIKHWRIHNYIQKDRYKPTVYSEEMSELKLKDNNAYTIDSEQIPTLDTECIQDGYGLEAQDRLGKSSLGKNSLGEVNILDSNESNRPTSQSDEAHSDIKELWNSLSDVGVKPIRKIVPGTQRDTLTSARIRQYGRESFDECIQNIRNSEFLKYKLNKTGITFDWLIKPNNYPKVLDGNYNDEKIESKDEWGSLI